MSGIRITPIIVLLRNNCPSWSVEGAVDITVIEDQSRLKLPAMYVGLAPRIYTNISEGTYLQEYLDSFFVMTCTPLKENHDRTGKYAQDFVPIARNELLMLLTNNRELFAENERKSQPIICTRDAPEKIDKARYYHRFDFSMRGWLDQNDVTPIQTDYFDTFFAEYNTTEFTDETPTVESIDKSLFFTPPNP
jgi:hypothetical protein